MNPKPGNEPIAIIGMACRFPGGANPGAFWDFLARGGDGVSDIPPDRWDAAAFYDPDPDAPGKMYTRRGAFIPGIDQFSPAFFGISPREAQYMDPQQRLLLEVAWEALEDAAVVPEKLAEREVGVYVGIGTTDYGDQQAALGPMGVDTYNGTGGSHAAAAGRLSYVLGVRGPSLAVDTACSSSLVTVHMAINSLRSGESDLALASGVNLNFQPDVFISLCKARMLSPDGCCKVFDARANGYVRGEGCGVLVLKRLCDALADGDHVHAVLRGSAVNHNGRSSGLTVPSGPAQQAVIRTALRNAGLAPDDVSYIEAHGTGTAVGDPIEAGAISAVFAGRETPLLLGSVKTNCGHLEWAAGVCGLVKTVLAMQHGVIPASLHLDTPNPMIKWDSAPFRVVTQPTPWPAGPRIAGVSSFGFGGTNAHVIVQEAPPAEAVTPKVERPMHLFALSARSETALRALAARHADAVEAAAPEALPDLCFTANVGRAHFEHRLTVRAASTDELAQGLRAYAAQADATHVRSGRAGDGFAGLAMLFTGQGSQRPGMGRELYDSQPLFRREIDRCAELLDRHLDRPLVEVLFPEGVASTDQTAPVHDTGYTQPALFAVEYALASLWRAWGVTPDVVLGHSVGEYVAACLSGVFSLEDGLKLIAARGRLMQALSRNGAMAAVRASEDRAAAAITPFADRVSLAAINGPEDVVISGVAGAVDAVLEQLARQGVSAQKLVVSHAFHSPLMDPILEPFRKVVEQVELRAPRLTLISNLTGAVAGEEVTEPDYWVRHVRSAVRFADGIRAAAVEGCTRFLEAGPQPVLCAMGQATLGGEGRLWLPSLHAKRGDWRQMLDSLAALEVDGADTDWAGFDRDYPRRKLPLPTYPFERQRYWFRKDGRATAAGGGTVTLRPLVDSLVRSPLVRETILSTTLGVSRQPYLADHKVHGQLIAPGAAYLAILASGAELMDWAACRISDVYFLAPLLLPDSGDRGLQAVLTPEPGEPGFSLEIVAPADEADETLRLASGRLDPITVAGETIDLASLQRRCATALSPQQVYAAASTAGVDLGPAFHWVDSVWLGDGEALAELSAPEAAGDLDGYRIHPAILDTCFQVAGATLIEETESDTLLPFAVKAVEVLGPPRGTSWWCHARRTGDTLWDIRLFGADGTVICALDGFEMRKASAGRLLRRRIADWLHRVDWRPQPLDAAPAARKPATWVVLDADSPLGADLTRRLTERGDRCLVVREAADATGFGRLLDQATEQPGQALEGVVDLRAAAPHAGSEDAAERGQSLSVGLLQLMQAVTARPERPPVQVVTRGAQAVLPGEGANADQASLWGLAASLIDEMPGLPITCIDVGPDPIGDIDALIAELDAATAETRVAYRDGERLVARLARSPDALPAPIDGPFRLRLKDYGSPDNLELVPMTREKPGKGQVEIEVQATSVNFRDVVISLGMLKDYYAEALGIARAEDIRLGFDCAGVVSALGEGVTDLAVGDFVMSPAHGGMASHVVTFRDAVMRVPQGMDAATAASIPSVFWTAYHALVQLAELKPGERVLIQAAAGGVGLAALQVAQAIGAEVYATASPGKWDYLKSLGVTHLMNSRTLTFADEILAATGGEGVDVVLNSLGGPAMERSFAALKRGGRFVEIGRLGSGLPEEAQARPDAAYFTFDLGEVIARDSAVSMRTAEEIVAMFETGQARHLPIRAYPIERASEAYRFVQQTRHVGKVVLTLGSSPLSDAASYLVTGGLGGLGLKLAEHMVALGARRLVLAGRSAPGEAAAAAIEKLQGQGADIRLVQGDVAQTADVERMIAACEAMAPLKGVIHAAGVLRDGFLHNQTPEQFRSVMTPKASGALRLHEQTRGRELDFFLLFSSVAGVVGSAAQTNYAAANAFLDGLAAQRRAEGLPALSLQWGPWAEVGMAAGIDMDDFDKVDVEGGLEVISSLLRAPARAVPAELGVFRIRWRKFLERWGVDAPPPFFASMAAPQRAEEPARGGFLDSYRAASPEARPGLLVAHIQGVLRQVLGLPADEKIDSARAWADYGLDSLMMVEVKNRLERSLRIALPVEKLIKDVSVDSLSSFLAERIGEAADAAATAGPQPSADEGALRREILERIQTLPQMFATVDAQDRRKVEIGGRWRIDFASCNYLGLDLEPEVMAAIPPALEAWGVHPSWTRAVASPRLYADLEAALAEMVGAPDTLVFPSISLLHLGVLPALAGDEGVIFKDVEAHHSIFEACQKAQGDGIEWMEFRHNSVEDLERRLARIHPGRRKIIATDGAYSMGSPNPPLHDYVRLARKYDALVYVDDAHGFGVFGADPDDALPYGYGGAGIVRHMGLDFADGRIVYVAGLSKAFSSYAAFVTCNDAETKALLQTSGPYVFSGPTSVASLASALAGLKLNRCDGDERRRQIHRLTRRLVAEARRIGFEVDNDADFPIVGVVIGDWEAMALACDLLWRHDILITPATFPAVPQDRGLVRFSLTSANTEAELDQAIGALEAVWAALHAGPAAETIAAQ